MKERRDEAQKSTRSSKTYSNAAAGGGMEATRVIPAVRDICREKEMGDNCTPRLHMQTAIPGLGVYEEIIPGVFTWTRLPNC